MCTTRTDTDSQWFSEVRYLVSQISYSDDLADVLSEVFAYFVFVGNGMLYVFVAVNLVIPTLPKNIYKTTGKV